MIQNKEYRYILPDENNKPITNQTECHSVIMIGSNGSGKTRLGVWIEKNMGDETHRISAQRALTFGTYINQKSSEQATNLLLYGRENTGFSGKSHDDRWAWDGEKNNYVTSMLNDYENVLSALVAKQANQREKYINDCKEKDLQDEQHDKVPEMVLDKLQRIWNMLFPHRGISISDGKVVASLGLSDGTKYRGRDMSDGERVALYLIAQCLSVPENMTIIIDEPEIHLHRSIINKIWTAIEAEREDCFFVYITHDTQFAASHKNSKKIWVKEYNGVKWEYEEVEDSSLPEQLLLDILGNRKPVLFVEGTSESYDTKLYSEIYKDYYVIACGSCSSVISQTKAMSANKQLHHLKCYGIIDRDYRSDYEIEAYRKDNIFTLKVAEVENLFLVEELLYIINDILGFNDDDKVKNVKDYIIKDRFAKEIDKQICEAIVSEIKFKLTIANISTKNEEEAKDSLESAFKSISYDELKAKYTGEFNEILELEAYSNVLKVFNSKSLSTSIGHFFGIDNKGYRELIVRHIKGNRVDEIIRAISPYLPEEIPIEINIK
ncbi:DUF4435 domain-containing protein [Abiotrophia defectiva]|uniref:DUF4435 domain-containing protein n=1 Tax=Abiotrophia defectiva TaxID=46125 RepID=UPI0026F16CC7|nr:DUF4435 domain-containing protein [Abiotrophia defectiva]